MWEGRATHAPSPAETTVVHVSSEVFRRVGSAVRALLVPARSTPMAHIQSEIYCSTPQLLSSVILILQLTKLLS